MGIISKLVGFFVVGGCFIVGLMSIGSKILEWQADSMILRGQFKDEDEQRPESK